MNSNAILIGTDENHPLIEINAIEYDKNKTYQKIPSLDSITSIASVAAQAAPALMTAKEIASKQIMEVVINGSLAQAADGNGFRAFSRVNGKIVEHARLFDADKLSKMVNVAAVWQVASVVVAQKHLADINKKLENLQEGVDKIIDFLETERKTRLLAIFESLKDIAKILAEIPPNQRSNIVNYERLLKYDDELKQIYLHLKADIEKYGFEKTEHKEMFGTADLKEDIEKKIKNIQELFQQAFLCLSLRLVCCNFMDYLDDMGIAKKILYGNVLEELEILYSLSAKFESFVKDEIKAMDSIVNRIQNNSKWKIATDPIGVTLDAVIEKPLENEQLDIFRKLVKSIMKPEKTLFGTVIKNTSVEKVGQGVLGQRKDNLFQYMEEFNSSCTTKYRFTKEVPNQSMQSLLEKEEPIKLAFQEIDESHVLCLNTGERIAIKK